MVDLDNLALLVEHSLFGKTVDDERCADDVGVKFGGTKVDTGDKIQGLGCPGEVVLLDEKSSYVRLLVLP